MRLDGHEQHALEIEHAISLLGDPAADPKVTISLMENYWAASFHWVAVGCQKRHGKHKENHTQLAKYLRDLGESDAATHWDNREGSRQGAMYAYQYTLADAQRAYNDWQAIRSWALSA
jgi:hypothetical protein